jgi:NMD protein affecting ribosome stability and mRNA decay
MGILYVTEDRAYVVTTGQQGTYDVKAVRTGRTRVDDWTVISNRDHLNQAIEKADEAAAVYPEENYEATEILDQQREERL